MTDKSWQLDWTQSSSDKVSRSNSESKKEFDRSFSCLKINRSLGVNSFPESFLSPPQLEAAGGKNSNNPR